MRESVKKKKGIIAISIAIVVSMVLSLTLGLLLSNPKGKTTDGFGTVASVDAGTNIGSGAQTLVAPSGWTEISNDSDLYNFLKSTTNKQGMLLKDVTYNLRNEAIDFAQDKILDGNGWSITLNGGFGGTNDHDEAEINNNTGFENATYIEDNDQIYTGLFVSRNQGIIRNVTLNYAGCYSVKANTYDKAWSMGVVCGKNTGTIQNVKVNLTGAFIRGVFGQPATRYTGQRLFYGTLCGSQDGNLNTVHVNMTNAKVYLDARNLYCTGLTLTSRDVDSRHNAVIGGVYGAYTGMTAAGNTYNLSIKADSNTLFQTQFSLGSRSDGNGRYNTTNSSFATYFGAIAGYRITGVTGVICDFKGQFNWKQDKTGQTSGSMGGLGGNGYKTDGAMAFTGAPSGTYYSTGNRICINNLRHYRLDETNPFKGGYQGYISANSKDYHGASDQYGYTGDNGTDPDCGLVENTTSKNWDMSNYEEVFGDLTMNFLPIDSKYGENIVTTKGVVKVDKDLTKNSNITNMHIIWEITGVSGYFNNNPVENTYIAGYREEGRSYSFVMDLGVNSRVAISTGRKFAMLNALDSQSYTGNDYFTTFAAQALNTKLTNGKTIREEVAAMMGKSTSDIVFNRSTVDFVNSQGGIIASLIFPEQVGNVTIRSKNNGTNTNFSYIDAANRFCVGTQTLNSLAMNPATIQWSTNGGSWTQGATDSNWLKEKTFTLKIDGVTSGNIIDRIEYKVDSEDKWTTENISYQASVDGSGNVTNTGLEFTIKNNTYGSTGEMILFKAYSGAKEVAFSQFGQGGAENTPVQLGRLKIDSNKPVIDTTDFPKLAEKWYNKAQEISFNIDNSVKVGDETKTQSPLSATMNVTAVSLNPDKSNITDLSFSLDTSKGIGKITFAVYARYSITVYDLAGNYSETVYVEAHIDSFEPEITGVTYKVADDSAPDGFRDYVSGTPVSQTVFAFVTVKMGPSQGHIDFFATDEEDWENRESTSDSLTAHTWEFKDGVYIGTYQCAIQKTREKDDTAEAVNYSFIFTSGSAVEVDEVITPTPSRWDDIINKVCVGQVVITLLIDNVCIDGVTKIYDGTSNYNGSMTINTEFTKQLGEGTKINDMIDWSAKFYNNFDPSSSRGTEAVDACIADSADNKNRIVLIFEIRAKTGLNFAIRNGQAIGNNYYVFQFGGTYTGKNDSINSINKIGIEKRELTIKANNAYKTYGQKNASANFSIDMDKIDIVDNTVANWIASDNGFGMLKTDFADFDNQLGKYLVFNPTADADDDKEDFRPENRKDAGMYSLTVNISADCTNYKLRGNVTETRADFRIYRKEISNIQLVGELNTITCYEVPNISAFFIDVDGKMRYLEIIYKNSDKEEIKFIPGQQVDTGKYFYVILLDDDTLKNYANTSDPNMLIGYFYVVGDKVEEGKSYVINGFDSEKDEYITVEFVNRIIDFRTLITFKEDELRSVLKIYYGSDEDRLDSNINEIGEYIITLRVEDNSRYADYTKEYILRVVPATVKVESGDLTAPTDYNEDNSSKNGVVYDNKVVNMNESHISANLRAKLLALLTEDEIKAMDGVDGDITKFFTFTYSYKLNNQTIKADRVVNAGKYQVTLVISGDKIKNVEISTDLYILTKEVAVEFDFSSFVGNDNFTIDGNTVNKLQYDNTAINFVISANFEKELRRLLQLEGDTALDGEAVKYAFSMNGNELVNAGNYRVIFNITDLFNKNIKLVNNEIALTIGRARITLTMASKFDFVYNGKYHYVELPEVDIKKLTDMGVDPFDREFGLYFGIEDYVDMGVSIERDRDNNLIRINLINAHVYDIEMRMAIANPNFQIANGGIRITIEKAKPESIEVVAKYTDNGVDYNDIISNNATIEIEYNGKPVVLEISENGKKELESYGIDWADTSQVEFVNTINTAAGTYEAILTIQNPNIDSTPYKIKVIINKKTIGDNVGKFNVNNWFIDGRKPTIDEFDNGMRYFNNNGVEAVYSLRLEDEAELIKEGFEIVYLYDGLEVEGVSLAGNHEIIARISPIEDKENWETKIVRLWELDGNGEFVTQSVTVYEKDDKNENIPREDNEGAVVKKERKVIPFTVLKAELQEEIESLATELALNDPKDEYDGLPHSTNFTDKQIAMLAERNIDFVMGKSSFINAGEHTVLVTFFKVKDDMTKDPNYEYGEMEATVTITPYKVNVQYEFDEKYINNSKNNIRATYSEGAEIVIRAFYEDLNGEKVYIDSLIFEKIKMVKGEEDLSEVTDLSEGIKPGKYLVTAEISDTNYVFDEEDTLNAFRFSIKNQTAATNTFLYILLAIIIIDLVAGGLIVLKIFRTFNPAVQEIDIDGVENF